MMQSRIVVSRRGQSFFVVSRRGRRGVAVGRHGQSFFMVSLLGRRGQSSWSPMEWLIKGHKSVGSGSRCRRK